MAEGWLRQLAAELAPEMQLETSSAGIEAHGVNPNAIRCMQEHGIDISTHRSEVLSDAMLERADIVVTVCVEADTHCPRMMSNKENRLMPFADPARFDGSEQEVYDGFRRVCTEIQHAMHQLILELKFDGYEQSDRMSHSTEQGIIGPVSSAVADGPTFTHDDVRILDRTIGYDSFLRVDSLTLQHRLFAGGWSQPVNRELLVKTAAVGVLLCDPLRRELVMVKQFRVGLVDAEESPWSLELVAGLVDTNETPEQVASREVKEETGLRASHFISICDYFNSPGASSERVSLYCARVNSSDAGGVHGLEHEHEDIQTVVLAESELNQSMLLSSGIINNAMSLIALQWWLVNRVSILAQWSELDHQ